MIKLSYCLRRLPSLSLEEFQLYWFEQHAPLVRTHGETLRIRRYVQLHSLDDPVNEAFQESRGGPEPYDGVAELWWDSVEDLQGGMGSPEGEVAATELLEDEKKFIDLPNSPLWIARERPIIGG